VRLPDDRRGRPGDVLQVAARAEVGDRGGAEGGIAALQRVGRRGRRATGVEKRHDRDRLGLQQRRVRLLDGLLERLHLSLQRPNLSRHSLWTRGGGSRGYREQQCECQCEKGWKCPPHSVSSSVVRPLATFVYPTPRHGSSEEGALEPQQLLLPLDSA